MATTFSKKVIANEGNWTVEVGVISKDPADVDLAQQFGDLAIDFSGRYVASDDPTFSFTIPDKTATYSNILLNKLPNVVFSHDFNDATIQPATRYRQAMIFANEVEARLQAALIALRSLTTTPPVNTTFIA
jgi:hypothetical protein